MEEIIIFSPFIIFSIYTIFIPLYLFYQMSWNHFPQLQPLLLQTLPSLTHHNLDNFHSSTLTSWKQSPKPFKKSKTAKLINFQQKTHKVQSKQDKFQQLLKKIQKVTHDYQQNHSFSQSINLSQTTSGLSFKKNNNQNKDIKNNNKSMKRVKTMKQIDLSHEHNVKNINIQSLESNNANNIKHNKQYQHQLNNLNNLNAFQKINTIRSHQNLFISDKQNLKSQFKPQFKKQQVSTQVKKINFDLNILQKVPVRQSINIDQQIFNNFSFNQNTSNPFNQIKQQLKISDFQLGTCIGSGKFGQVYKCKHKKTNFICALKKILKATIQQYKMIDQFIRQLKISYIVNHPNVVKTYAHFHDQFHVFLLMEYAVDGSAIDNLQFKKGQQFSSHVLFQTLNAVDHLHRHKIVHRDIKPQNLVVFFKDTYKLCDFGLSAFVNNQMKHTFCGTPDYVSPEMKDVGEYDFSVDLWSLGVLAYELITGEPPFKDKISEWKKSGWKKTNYWTWKVEYPRQIKQAPKQFIKNLLKQKPQQRSNIRNCLGHQFINKHNKGQIDIIKSAQNS